MFFQDVTCKNIHKIPTTSPKLNLWSFGQSKPPSAYKKSNTRRVCAWTFPHLSLQPRCKVRPHKMARELKEWCPGFSWIGFASKERRVDRWVKFPLRGEEWRYFTKAVGCNTTCWHHFRNLFLGKPDIFSQFCSERDPLPLAQIHAKGMDLKKIYTVYV